MLKTQIWKPDTCKCEIEQTWDDSLPDNERVVNFSKIIQSCTEHINLEGNATYTQVMDENTRKNKAFGILQKEGVLDIDTNKALEDYNWSFDGQRNLIISLPKVSDKTVIQSVLDSQLGKVEVA